MGNCLESMGCVEVEIIEVWNHENHSQLVYNDIAVVK